MSDERTEEQKDQRAMIAAMLYPAVIAQAWEAQYPEAAEMAVKYADALIAELEK